MSDHEPPVRPSKRGSADGYDPFVWARYLGDALHSSSTTPTPTPRPTAAAAGQIPNSSINKRYF